MNTKVEKDFGDWLSPMLVKEIRQGFRSKVFVSAFLLIQGLMIFCVIMSLILSTGDLTDSSSVLFWILISIPILLLPFNGFGVLGSELKGNTMELLFLTRLSAWRIVAGKWTAIVAQMLLIVCSVLPYTVLRYFIGGVNLLGELEALLLLMACSALLTGICVALSPFYRSLLARMFLPVFLISMVIFVISFSGRYMAMGGGGMSVGNTFLFIGILGPLFLLLMFEIAVARIAPPAENHSFRKRLLGWCILGALALLNKITHESDTLHTIGILLLLPVCITALCEELKPIPSIYLPFLRRGFPGRIASWFFSPGWAPGMHYTIVTLIAFLYIFYTRTSFEDLDTQMSVICFVGALLTPLAIAKLFFEKFQKTFAVYACIQVFMFVSMIIASTLKNSMLSDWMKIVSPMPTSVFFLHRFGRIDDSDKPFFIATTAFALAVSIIILVVKSANQWREVRVLEQKAREDLMKPRETKPQVANANAA